ncbi:uncharacterized protein LOC126152346 [Schistocerca cancellata]|uniref:uncharacterized protein LOC126152346 n=1 Tax=Schistocerca cancellata TaxID=274614 RepID=UPI0021175AD9|nr:uncharacterized protein LOC126152346 [Schistocerca cancellata]
MSQKEASREMGKFFEASDSEGTPWWAPTAATYRISARYEPRPPGRTPGSAVSASTPLAVASRRVACDNRALTMATLGTLKRGSVQIQRAAIKATGRIAARHLMEWLVAWAVVLVGVLEHSATSQLLAPRPPLSPEEFAELVANTSYVSRYCRATPTAAAADNFTTDLPPDNDTEVTTLPTMSTLPTASSEETDSEPEYDEDAGAEVGAEEPLLASLTAVASSVGVRAFRGVGSNHSAVAVGTVHGRHVVIEPDLKVSQ